MGKTYRTRIPINALGLVAHTPTEYDDYCRRMDRERVPKWVRRHCFEEAEEAEEQKQEEQVEEPEEAEADLEG